MEKGIDLKEPDLVLNHGIQRRASKLRDLQNEVDTFTREREAIKQIKLARQDLDKRSVEFDQRESVLRGSIPELEAQATQKKATVAELERQEVALRGVIAKLQEQAETEQDTIERLEARKAELETEVGRLAGRVEVQRAERRVS